ncbi:hypothetical protein [Nostoc sp.]|uniref:hypothetical protein n=1 Tax=Nostoc sp. TaxID=1180 RepID=UPI002FF8A6C3
MLDELRLDSVPVEEGHQQPSTDNYRVRAQNESKVYKKQLLSLFRDELELGAAPHKEKYHKIGTPDYDALAAKSECRVFKQYLQRLFPIPQELEDKVSYRIRGYNSDFGTYYKVSILFDDNNLEALNFACSVGLENFPANWDEIALRDLRSLGLG